MSCSTKTQLFFQKSHCIKLHKVKKRSLNRCPQKKGTCVKVFVMAPKKPNSASRKVTRVMLSSKKRVLCHIPGIKHNLQKYSSVLVRGGRVRDLPAVKYRVVRGKFDLKRVQDRIKARSKYGIPRQFVS